MVLGRSERYAAALAALDLSPARLRRVLHDCAPDEAWVALGAGCHPEDPDGRSRGLIQPDTVDEVARACERAGVGVRVLGEPGYPDVLARDEEAPAVLFFRGDLGVCAEARPRVAVVGTRSASSSGLAAARDMGHGLASAGVVVVSGLAAGIDTAVLTGAERALGSPSIAVLGTAHDGRAGPEQRDLRDVIARRGVVLSEQAPGRDSPRWRFVSRNRIMAALASMVVVVESHERGGALHTVVSARRRNIPVAAVPGSTRNAAASGTNALLVSGARCVRHGTDVLDALCLPPGSYPSVPHRPPSPRVPVEPELARVLGVLEPEPADLGTVVRRSGESLPATAQALERLAQRGQAASDAGWWYRVELSGE